MSLIATPQTSHSYKERRMNAQLVAASLLTGLVLLIGLLHLLQQPQSVQAVNVEAIASKEGKIIGLKQSVSNFLLPVMSPVTPTFQHIVINSELDDTYSAAWGDMDGDGDLDILVGNANQQNKIYRNDGSDNFTYLPNALPPGTDNTLSIAWGDMDGDGDLDILVGNYGQNKIYRNDGDGNFTYMPQALPIESDTTNSVDWGDMDGDGYLDILASNDGQNKVYLNDGSGNFALLPNALPQETDNTRSIAWGDMDGDGDLDILAGNYGQQNKIYRNIDGSNTFTLSSALPEIDLTWSIAWGDMDGDGDLDILVGNFGPQTDPLPGAQNMLYRNDGNGSFTDITTGALPADLAPTTSVAWGDMDGDGDLDIVTGNSTNHLDKVYRNDDGIFTDITRGDMAIDRERTNSIAWGDMDNDGDLDVLAGNGGYVDRVYRNDGGINFININSAALAADTGHSNSVAWGDMEGDGDLDIIVGNGLNQPNHLYRNDGGGKFTLLLTAWPELDTTNSVAWGDMDGDGDLDILAGNGGQNKIYSNDGSGNFALVPGALPPETDDTYSIAWGDMDGDGDLDILAGNSNQQNKIYRNEGNSIFAYLPNALPPETDNTQSIAWGDMDGDGDLDILVGNHHQQNKIYRNEGNSTFAYLPNALPPETDDTTSVAWGDMDSDGDLDVLVGSPLQPKKVYRNNGDGSFTDITDGDLATDADWTWGVAWGDVDGDGNLDILSGNENNANNKIYRNDSGGVFTDITAGDLALENDRTFSIAWGDMEGDGDLDILIGNIASGNKVYTNTLHRLVDKAGVPPIFPAITHLQAAANFYAQADYLDERYIPISYTLYSLNGLPIGGIHLYYSLNGGGQWRPMAVTNTQLTNLATSPWPTGTTHVFTWDTFASGFFGQSDNVTVRLVAIPQAITDLTPGTFTYSNQAAGPIQYGASSATTFPFRVRGTQIRVVSDTISGTQPISQAIVYLLPEGQSNGAQPFVDLSGEPYRTDAQGYLQGRGEIYAGDTLFALAPIFITNSYTVYATNIQASATTLEGTVFNTPGVQTITVSADNPLILFNLNIALEWDARQDDLFLDQLKVALNRTSDVLMDVSNGQMALGEVNVYQAKEHWLDPDTDMLLFANNNLRPNANIGGTVLTDTTDIINGTIMKVYFPGKIRMGPNWDPTGNSSSELNEEWWRALAHELGHYFLYLPDNYIGLKNGRLIATDCYGSFMTNSSNNAYSEFLFHDNWVGACQRTIAQNTTGRSDWETIVAKYPYLFAPIMTTNPGPAIQPLAVTHVNIVTPQTAEPLPMRNYDLRDEDNHILSLPQASGFLIKRGHSAELDDDYIVELGHPGGSGDYLRVRGAEPGDQVCVLAQGGMMGCTDVHGVTSTITINSLPDWQPDIQITPGSSTITVTVVQTIASGESLHVQLYPAYEPLDPYTVLSPFTVMSHVSGTLTHTAVLTTEFPVIAGQVRIWATGSVPIRESIVPYVLATREGDVSNAFGATSNAWGATSNAWGAPVTSGNGAVSVINAANVFSDTGIASLQALPTLPHLPSWLLPVGTGYRVRASRSMTQPISRAIGFHYLQREVPPGYENVLNIYFLSVNGSTWLPLSTTLNITENLALAEIGSTAAEANGIYALMATVPIAPGFEQGWNNFGYPVQQTRMVVTALAAIEGKYTAVAHHDAHQNPPWRTFYPTLTQPLFYTQVNTLDKLLFPRVYWLYATEAVTLYLSPPNSNQPRLSALETNGLELPPATYYGWVTPTIGFNPQVRDIVTAMIGGNICGTSTITNTVGQGQLAYVIQVRADSGNGCGRFGREVVFSVAGQVIPQKERWLNFQACYHSLSPIDLNEPACLAPYQLYLPVMAR